MLDGTPPWPRKSDGTSVKFHHHRWRIALVGESWYVAILTARLRSPPSSPPLGASLQVSWRPIGHPGHATPPRHGEGRAPPSSNIMGHNRLDLFPLRFKAPIGRSHPPVRLDQYPSAPSTAGAHTSTSSCVPPPESPQAVVSQRVAWLLQ